MKNLAHSASLESLDKDAPSKAGTKHLGVEPQEVVVRVSLLMGGFAPMAL
jgi:hypothetical protein